MQPTLSSPRDLVTPGRNPPAGFEFPSRVVASNLLLLLGALISKGLNRSRIACRAALRWFRFCAAAPVFAFWRFCFLDCWGPITPLSRSEAFSCFNCEGGIVVLKGLCGLDFFSLRAIRKKNGSTQAVDRDSAERSPHLQCSSTYTMAPFSGDGVLWLCLGEIDWKYI